jgi:hypothetical protein
MTIKRPQTEDELIDLVHSIDIEAPPALRARVDDMVAQAAARRGRPRPAVQRRRSGRWGMWRARPLAGAFALAVLVAALVVALTSGGGSQGLSLRSAAAPTLLASTTQAPVRNDHSEFLAAEVGGVRFPYLEDGLGWRSSGARTDTVAGRTVTTVFYSRGAARVGYSIYAGVPAPSSRGGVARFDHGTGYRVLAGNGTAIISWERDGHLCVMSSTTASASQLIHLAGWSGGSATAA